jgi:hypothetical protein
MIATVRVKRALPAADQGLGHVLGVGLGVEQVLGDAGALLGGEGGDGGQNAAQGDGNVVNVVHQANGFSGERHGFPRGRLPSLL